jgi:L-ascorbate metabolism protein UlaG (beta-lactamase superfamily)
VGQLSHRVIKPLLQNDALLADITSARNESDRLHLWWLGQSGYLLQWQGSHLLLDPYLSDSLTTKYAASDKPHIRISERVIAPECLTFVDAVTSSHNHTDHLDPETLRPLVQVNPRLRLICARANLAEAARRSGLADSCVIGLDPDDNPVCLTVGPFEIRTVPAAHEDLACDALDHFLYVGFVVKAGPHVVYHSGDTVLYPGIESRLLRERVTIALLPINGRSPKRRVAGNLWGREAAQLAKDVEAKLVVPCHYDLFEFNTATPDEFVTECHRLQQPHRILQLGERLSWPLVCLFPSFSLGGRQAGS